MNIVYMGTPDFAVEPLRRLLSAGYRVVGVVTMPDKAVGRHHDTLQSSPVKRFAESQGIPVLQPEKLRDETFLAALRALKADLQIVVAFRMLPEVVWAMPRLGTFNLHAALLPQYRGAAPINWAIINGEKETGCTTFFLDHHIDTGRIILQERCPIHESDNAEDVHDRLMHLGARLVVETVERIENGTAEATPQEQFATNGPLRPAPKIYKDTCRINWQQPAARVRDFIRGLSPYPGAWTLLRTPDGRERELKVFAARLGEEGPLTAPCLDGPLTLAEVQLAGKRRMRADDFMRGAHLEDYQLI